MTFLPLPDPELIRSAPECAALALADFALALVASALRLEHPRLGPDRLSPIALPPRPLLLAEFLLERSAELRILIAHYNTAVDHSLGLDLDSDNLPF
jgi:hypothetical protein